VLSCVVLLVSGGVALAQGPGRGRDLPRNTFDLGARTEWWEVEGEVVGNSNTGMTDSELNSEFDFWTQHTTAMITGDYRHNAPRFTFIGHVGLGVESITGTFEDLTFDEPGWTHYDTSFVWEIGAAGRVHFGMADAGLSVLYRGGMAEVDLSMTETFEYDYSLLRFGGEFGIEPAPGVRPFIGLRYTLYDAEWTMSETGFPDATIEFEFDRPVGLFLGIDLGTVGPVGRIEIMIVDVDFGMGASAGWRF
jgi:hypothetical protein